MFLNPAVDPIRLSTSWLFTARTLSFIRTFLSLYAFATILTVEIYNPVHYHDSAASYESFSYFTVLSYWGLAFYFAVAAFHSATYWFFNGKPALASWGAVLIQFQSIFYSTIVVYPFIVTIVYWSLLYAPFPDSYTLWANVSRHGLNSAYALFEIIFTRADPLPWIHLLWLLCMLALYVGVAYITKATEGFYVYSFLDPHRKGGQGLVSGYVFGIMALAIVTFVIVKYVILLRKWITETKLDKTGKLEYRGERRHGDERIIGDEEKN